MEAQMKLFNDMKAQEDQMLWEVSSLENNFGQDEFENFAHPTSLFSNQPSTQDLKTPVLQKNQSLFQNLDAQDEIHQAQEFGLDADESALACQKDDRNVSIRNQPENNQEVTKETKRFEEEFENISFFNPEIVSENYNELYLKLDEFSHQMQDNFQGSSTESHIQNIDSWVSPKEEEDITVEPSSTPEECKKPSAKTVPFHSTQDESASNDGKSDIVATESAEKPKKNGFESYAASFSCSQHQSFHKALEGSAEYSAYKGSSEKETNALSIRRSCFRALSAYFKKSFSKFNRAWQDKRRNKKKTKDMNAFIDTYISQEFGEETMRMDPAFLKSLRDALISILHSHRYKKKEEFTKDIDFSIIRDVLYSYTLEARERFMSQPAFALIYHHFFVNGAYKFLISKVQCKSKLTAFELEKELVSLHYDAVTTLQ